MKKAIATLAWISGILLAGAEGPILINFIGLAVFCGGCMGIKKWVPNA